MIANAIWWLVSALKKIACARKSLVSTIIIYLGNVGINKDVLNFVLELMEKLKLLLNNVKAKIKRNTIWNKYWSNPVSTIN